MYPIGRAASRRRRLPSAALRLLRLRPHRHQADHQGHRGQQSGSLHHHCCLLCWKHRFQSSHSDTGPHATNLSKPTFPIWLSKTVNI
jgi:hypothetical protein